MFIKMNIIKVQKFISLFIGNLSFHAVISVIIFLCVVTFNDKVTAQSSNNEFHPRIIITCDPELDDNNSLIRFLLYSCDVDIEGLIYASSGFHWKGDGKNTKRFVANREYDKAGLHFCPCVSWRWANDEHFINSVVNAYAKVYPNLKLHHSGYPSPEVLLSKIFFGNIEFDGDISKDSPGSNLIKSLMLDDKPGKLFITAWGGQSTIARALKSIQMQYENTNQWAEIKDKIDHKVILLPSGDQDDTYATYIKPNWPEIEYRELTGGPNYGYGAQINAKPQDSMYMTASWIKKNISDRGPLGKLYRVWGDGKQMVKGDKFDYFGLAGYTDEELRTMGYIIWKPVQEKGSWISEGDSGTFMNILNNGLYGYEDGTYGGWGGYGPNGKVNQETEKDDYPDFFPAAQRDFAARLKWSVTQTYSGANHEPIVKIKGSKNITASAGDKINLYSAVSDPDGNIVTVKWWQFRMGTYPNKVKIINPETLQPEVNIPADAVSGQTIHIILEGTDNGSPALTQYQRVIITVK